MDENFCEDETSKSVENVVDGQKPKEVDNSFELEDLKIKAEEGNLKIKEKEKVSDRCESNDASVSGTSTDVSTLAAETPESEVAAPSTTQNIKQPVSNEKDTQEDEEEPNTSLLPIYEESQSSSLRVPAYVEQQLSPRKASIGPPPTYSFVMKQKKKVKVPSPIDPVISNRPPPPAYVNSRVLFPTPEDGRLERMCNLPSFRDPTWRSHSQPAFCNRCGVIVLSTTHTHDSIATHLAALALCLFGCWPCCLLPYCLNVCKNTHHHCPVCQAFLGVYSPW